MPRKKKTEDSTPCVETPKKEEKISRYGAIALKQNAALKKPSLRGNLK